MRPSLRLIAVALLLASVRSFASVALLMEEPFGEFGAFNPTGHAAVYLSNICAETPLQLRPCRAGEYGSVISRYHKIDGKDWIAMPLVRYLYAVDTISEIPQTVAREDVERLRDAAWKAHLQELAPSEDGGDPPGGEWVQLVGSSYDRSIHGFQIDTTPEQDERFMALFNDKKNRGHFNLLAHNCADFSREVLDTYFPKAEHRSLFADFGIMTPKQAARSLVQYSKKHPELHMTAFLIPQVPGTVKRSIKIDGVSESLVKSKKYLIPLAVLAPEATGGVVADYLVDGRHKLPKNARMFEIGDVVLPGEPANPAL
ncbi:hypothetical protein [Terriglobus tenax]|uniref:hypothetical protein n=1 Tax=Terriglobus tenax TaxID=1111115 RepID=UPI0021DF795C|nr:hypothetical protein [Terriglobus tenax]